MDRDSDPFSLLARAMRVCDEPGLRSLEAEIEKEFDRRDLQRIEDALAKGTLLTWRKNRREYIHTTIRHRAVECGPITVWSNGSFAKNIKTLCNLALESANIHPEGPYRFDREGDSENDARRAKYSLKLNCKKCIAKVK